MDLVGEGNDGSIEGKTEVQSERTPLERSGGFVQCPRVTRESPGTRGKDTPYQVNSNMELNIGRRGTENR